MHLLFHPDFLQSLGRHVNGNFVLSRIVAEIERHIPVSKICSIDEVACRLLDNENDEDSVREIGRAHV
mgnify:CR=1 FL=1